MKRFFRNSFFIIRYSNKNGQSLVEVLVALAVGTLLIIGATSAIIPALRTNTQADKVQVSASLGKELLENLRAFSEGDWHNVSNLATSSANKYFLLSVQSPFAAVTGTEGIVADGTASGLAGYWKLDESTGTTAYDFSGNNVTGTLLSSPWFAAGKVGNGLSSSGTSAYVSMGDPSSIQFDINTPFSVTFWLKIPTVTVNTGYVRKSTNIHGLGWYVWTWPSTQKLSFNINPQTTNIGIGSAGIITDNAWHHVAATYTGSSNRSGMKIYIDGVINATGTAQTTTGSIISTTPLTMKSAGGGGEGKIDDVRIYNRALSAAEVKNIYSGGIYTRYFFIDAVGRDAGGAILSSGGTNDPSTRKATVVYGWLNGPTSSFSTYLTRFRNDVFSQTDWSAGPGQDGPATSTNSQFASSTQIDYTTSTGSISIQLQ